MWKKIKSMLILFTLMLLTNCQNSEDKTVNTLKINFQEGDLPSLHAHNLMTDIRGMSIAKTLYECLTRIDAKGHVQMAGAKSVDISPDQMRYTFTLRDNHWSDGTPVTAFQYEDAWKEALSPTSSCSRADLLYMVKNAEDAKKGLVPLDCIGVKALDKKTLVVELAYPSAYFLELVSQSISAPMISPQKKEQTIFNGPFLVDSRKYGDYLKLTPNPHYWNAKQIALKQIDIYMAQDTMTAYSMFEKKQIDWIGMPLINLSPELIDQLRKTNVLKSRSVDRVFWVFLNAQHQALSSASIRKALSLAIDRDAITQHILVGDHPLSKPLPHTVLPLQGSSALKKNVDEAKQYFEQGLKELNLTKETFPPLIISYSQQANRKQLAEYLQQTWSNAFGTPFRLEAQEWNVLRCNLEKGNYVISGCYQATFYKDPLELLDKFTVINSINFSKWISHQFTEKVALAKQQNDPKHRAQLFSEAEHILMEQMPFIPICTNGFSFAHKEGLKGYAFDYAGAIDFSYASF